MTDNKKLGIMFLLLFMTTLFALPNGIDLRLQRTSYLILSMLMCGGFYVFWRLDKYAGALILWSAFVAISKGIDVQTAIVLISFLAVYVGISHYHGSRERVYDFFIAVACVNLVFQIAQDLGFHFLFVPNESAMMYPGLMANVNETSAMYALTSAACLRKGRYWFLIVMVTGLILSVSLGGVLAFSGMMFIWALKKFQNIQIQGAIIAVVLAFFVFYGIVVHPFALDKRKGRFFVWEMTAKTALLQYTGFGWGQYAVVMPLLTSWKYIPEQNKKALMAMVRDQPAFAKAIQNAAANDPNIFEDEARQQSSVFAQCHQEFIEFAFTAGPIGLAILLIFIGHILLVSFKSTDTVPFYGIIAVCGTCMTFFTLHIITTAVITTFYVAWANHRGEKI